VYYAAVKEQAAGRSKTTRARKTAGVAELESLMAIHPSLGKADSGTTHLAYAADNHAWNELKAEKLFDVKANPQQIAVCVTEE